MTHLREKKWSVLFFRFLSFHVTFAYQFGLLGRMGNAGWKCSNETHLRVENINLQSIPDAGWVIWESAGWHSSVSKLLLFLTACRERRLVRRGDLVLPGDVAAKHMRGQSSHTDIQLHIYEVSQKYLILFFMHIFSLDIIQLESGFISRATFILIIFLLLRNRRFSLFHTVTQENHSSSLSHLFRPLIIQQGLSENRTQSVCSCLTKRHRQRGELYQLCAPWFWASLSSLNWVTCWWSLASFGIWKPRLASDVGDWQEEEVSDDRPGFQQEEEDASVWFPGVKSSVFSAAVLKWDGSISLAPGPLREGEAAAGVETKSCLKPEKYAPELLQPPFSVQCKLNHHGTLFCTHWLPANEP